MSGARPSASTTTSATTRNRRCGGVAPRLTTDRSAVWSWLGAEQGRRRRSCSRCRAALPCGQAATRVRNIGGKRAFEQDIGSRETTSGLWRLRFDPAVKRIRDGLGDLIRAGLVGALVGLGPAAARRFIRLGNAKREHRGRLLDGNEWFLDIIGVDPALARRGFARRLIAPQLARADQERRACFLETSDPGNEGTA